jgi:hypothetical protein
MSLFGEKCDRCGTRTKHKEEGHAICEACVAEMEVIVTAANEEPRSCPVDGAQMTKEVAHMLVIDRCPDCKGVWLDGGELDRIKDGVESNAVLLMARGMSGPF